MIFRYKGKTYDTAKSEGSTSTNQLQITKDNTLKKVVTSEWFGDDQAAELLKDNQLDVLFQFALMSARSQDINCMVTGDQITTADTYPDWVTHYVDERIDRGY